MDFTNFIGFDSSKQTFDFALILMEDPSNVVSDKVTNTPPGIVRLQEFIKRQHLDMDKTLFCMEHTGIYCRLLSGYLTENHYHVWLEMPVQIIRSMGLQRGKNDRIDAVRIARYALMKREKQRCSGSLPKRYLFRSTICLPFVSGLLSHANPCSSPSKKCVMQVFRNRQS